MIDDRDDRDVKKTCVIFMKNREVVFFLGLVYECK